MNAFPLSLLPRRCPQCDKDSIIGHGRRRKQAHDEHHDWIWVRRGLCPRCGMTFTILPDWSPPSGQYTLRCRQQAWDATCRSGVSWEQSASPMKDANRLPDPATLRRWAFRRFLSLFCVCKTFWSFLPDGPGFFRAPTILAWDWPAAGRTLRLEAKSP